MLIWQIYIDNYSCDGDLIGRDYWDIFESEVAAKTFVKEYCALHKRWKVTKDYSCDLIGLKQNKDGSFSRMSAGGPRIAFPSWKEYVKSKYRVCKIIFKLKANESKGKSAD